MASVQNGDTTLSETPHGYLQFSKPVLNPADGYYYQSYRYLDLYGNVIGYGPQSLKSWEPNSTLGLFKPALDGFKTATYATKLGGALWGVVSENLRLAAGATISAIKDYNNGLTGDWGAWPGTTMPWVNNDKFWQTGDTSIDFLQHSAPGTVGDGHGIGNWRDNLAAAPQNQSSANPWANIPVPDYSTRTLGAERAWNYELSRDSAAAAGVPSRNNVWEYGFPESPSPAVRNDTSSSTIQPQTSNGKNFPRLGRRIFSNSPASTSDTRATVAPDHQNVFDDQFGGGTALPAGITPRNPNWAVPAPETGSPRGIFSGRPAPLWAPAVPISGLPDQSPASGNINANRYTTAVRTIPPAARSGSALSLSGPVPQNAGQSGPSPIAQYLRYLNQRDANEAPASGGNVPAAPVVRPDSRYRMGDLADWIAALAGVDPRNPAQTAPLPQAGQLRRFSGDDPAQPQSLQRKR
jgi:hypothetical protein